MKFILSIILIVLGFLLVWQANWIVTNFGRIDWAEIHLGTDGGTRIFWKLLGLIIIIIAMLYMFGFIQGIIGAIFSPLFRANNL